MAEFYSVLMTLNLLCAISILLSGVSSRKVHFLALAILNLLLFVFHWVSLELHSANELSEAKTISKLHLAVIITALPLYVFIFGMWSRYKSTKFLTCSILAVALPLLVINSLSESSFRYGPEVELVSYMSVFGEKAYLLAGQNNSYFPIFHLLFISVTLLLTYFAYRFFQRKQNTLSLVLFITLLMQILVSYVGYLIDNQASNLVYLGGVPMSLLSLWIVCAISRGYKVKSQELDSEVSQKEGLYQVFSKLAKISNEDFDSSFYSDSLKLLSEFCKADYLVYGLIDEKNPTLVSTKIFIAGGELLPNFSYEREGTPCENVLSQEACVHKSGVAVDYPRDLMLAEEGIEAYVGYPISGNDKKSIGVLALLFKNPLIEEKLLRTVTDVFATRISAELRREKLQQELKATAYIDYLTRLPNRAKLLEYINLTRMRSGGRQRDALIMLFDLDHFGEINRKYGYEVGDHVIRQIGERLGSYSSDNMFIARSGGDEFALIIPHIKNDISNLASVHWTAVRAIVTNTCYVGNRRINVDCSMGAVVFSCQLESNFDVIGAAEQALLQAKEHGRDRFSFFEPSLLSQLEYRREMESDLLQAIKSNRGLEVYYQPKVNREGKLVGAEALLRWIDPERGFVSPAEFIPLAEETGVIHKLGAWVLERVLSDINYWADQSYLLVPISINVTASQFDDEEFISSVFSKLKRHSLPFNLIELELTESGLLSDKDKAISTLSQIRALGIGVALDDFGTGYSSLSYLSKLPLDVLKIDKSFVDGLDDERNKELVKSIIAIGKTMELLTVAEGTETLEQVELLSSYGCDYFQGYYFSKPLQKADFEGWLNHEQVPVSTQF